jgi:hypothetical protein
LDVRQVCNNFVVIFFQDSGRRFLLGTTQPGENAPMIEAAFHKRVEHAVHQPGQHLRAMLTMLHEGVRHGGKA